MLKYLQLKGNNTVHFARSPLKETYFHHSVINMRGIPDRICTVVSVAARCERTPSESLTLCDKRQL